MIAGAGEGYRKQLWTADGGGLRPVLATCPDQQSQAEAVCQSILEHHESGILLKDQVVLFRTSHHSDLLEVELGRRKIPFVKFGGLRFLEAAHVRDLVAALRVVGNPWDELAWMRVLQMADGIGPGSANRIVEALGVRNPGSDGPNPLGAFCSNPAGERIAHRSVEDLTQIASGLGICTAPGLPPGPQVEALRHTLEPMIRRRYDHPEPRLADLDALAGLASGYENSEGFLADLTLDPPASTGDLAGKPTLDDDWLTLSTVHSAKGGEWAAVHLIHAADGAFPSDLATGDKESVDEERRLFYVRVDPCPESTCIFMHPCAITTEIQRAGPTGTATPSGHGFFRLTWTSSWTFGPYGVRLTSASRWRPFPSPARSTLRSAAFGKNSRGWRCRPPASVPALAT